MNIKEWVNSAKNADDTKFRKAIHLILLAISKDKNLSHTLVLKGGIVMSLVYGGERYTSDLDASSLSPIDKLTPEQLEKDLTRYLKGAEIEVGYGLVFNIHSIKPQPKVYKDAKYPAYKVKIGVAQQDNKREMAKLLEKQSSFIIEIDISFNESVMINDTECFALASNRNILCYSLEQIIAEKYRSLLQQPVRNRYRRQDVYDIYHLLNTYHEHFYQDTVKIKVLDILKKCSQGKNIDEYLHQNGIYDKKIREMALKDFDTLDLEVDLNKIDANVLFDAIADYFHSLPW